MSYYKPFHQSAYDRTVPVYSSSQYGPAYYGPYDRPYSYQSRAPMRGEQWSEYIPVEQRYTDYVLFQQNFGLNMQKAIAKIGISELIMSTFSSYCTNNIIQLQKQNLKRFSSRNA